MPGPYVWTVENGGFKWAETHEEMVQLILVAIIIPFLLVKNVNETFYIVVPPR